MVKRRKKNTVWPGEGRLGEGLESEEEAPLRPLRADSPGLQPITGFAGLIIAAPASARASSVAASSGAASSGVHSGLLRLVSIY